MDSRVRESPPTSLWPSGGRFRRVGHFREHKEDEVLRAMEGSSCRDDKFVYESTAGKDEKGWKQYHIVIF
jgi:hypothetical protein